MQQQKLRRFKETLDERPAEAAKRLRREARGTHGRSPEERRLVRQQAGRWPMVSRLTAHVSCGILRSRGGVRAGTTGSGDSDIPNRGYQPIQTIIRNDKIDGIAIDRNLTKNDEFRGSVLWLSGS